MGEFHVPDYDTAFTITNSEIPGMEGLDITRVRLMYLLIQT